MPQLNAQQNLDQGAAWGNYATALQNYATARADDDAFDNVTSLHWRINALQISKQYYLSAINAAYDDAGSAFTKLQAVTNASAADVSKLTAATNSWNKFADVANAMEGLAVALGPPFNPIKIIGAAEAVAKVV